MIRDQALNLLVEQLVEHRDMVVECDDGEDPQKNNTPRTQPATAFMAGSAILVAVATRVKGFTAFRMSAQKEVGTADGAR
jgi:hypothetical protein